MLLLGAAAGEESGAGRVLEDLADALARPCGTLEIVPGADLLRDGHALCDSSAPGSGGEHGWQRRKKDGAVSQIGVMRSG
jgi:hypothetical protein